MRQERRKEVVSPEEFLKSAGYDNITINGNGLFGWTTVKEHVNTL